MDKPIRKRKVPSKPFADGQAVKRAMPAKAMSPAVVAADGPADLTASGSALAMAVTLVETPTTPIMVDPEPAPAELNSTEPGPAARFRAEAEPIISEPAAEAAPDVEQPSSPQPDPTAASGPTISKPMKDMIMDMTNNFGSNLNDALAEAQGKAKEVYEKSSTMIGEAGTFTRGNVEAVVEAGKILAAGLQDMSTNLVAESRGAFDTMTADLKELAASKTPTDFFKIQSEMMRKNLESAVAYGSKNSEAMLKLVNEALAPLSGRASMAIDKVKSTTI